MSAPEEYTVSWLTMERYALGELAEDERREVERCLARSEAARARLAAIMEDSSELPELPAVAPLAPARARRARAWSRGGAALAAAALAGLAFVSLRDAERAGGPEHIGGRVKGGEFAMQLVSESEIRDPDTFAQGERFKVLVTSPPDHREPLRFLVFQAGQRFEPLAPARIRGGNLAVWPGAFALDGHAPAEVCMSWGSRSEGARTASDLGDSAVCKTLAPR
jgi:hypothetical protein